MAADIEHLQVSANGITFHVAASRPADAPPVLCLHGFPEGSMSWRPVMERLGEARVYAPDLRGYPGSGRPEHGYDVGTLTDDIAALIEALGIDRPLLVAHDWGGALGSARSCGRAGARNSTRILFAILSFFGVGALPSRK